MKEKKKYANPTWGVIEMRQKLQLLQISGLDPFNNGGDPLNP